MVRYRRGRSHLEITCRCHGCQNLSPGYGRLPRRSLDRPALPALPAPSSQVVHGLESTTANPVSPSLGLSVQQAFARVEQNLKVKNRNDIACLQTSSLHLFDKASLPWMIFQYLDAAIFCHVLIGNVCLRFAKLPYGCWSRTSRAGLRYSRITIELSSSLIYQCSRQEIMAKLLHQMIHAYYLQCCGYRNPDVEGTGHDLCHGHEFRILLDIIQGFISGPGHRHQGFPSLWGPVLHNGTRKHILVPGQSNCYDKEHYSFEVDAEQRRPDARAVLQSSKSSSKATQASSNAEVFNEDRSILPIDDWLHLKGSAGTVTVDCHRSRYRYSPDAFIELHFDKRAYPVSRQFLEAFPAIGKSKLFENRIVSVPKSCGGVFDHLLSFLTRKIYLPSLEDLHSAQPGTLDRTTGPPCILSRDDQWPAYLVTDIKVYRLAKEIGFPELCKYVLERLNKQTYTRDDPLEVLEEVYHKLDTEHRDKDLRDWIKAWLMTPIPSSLGDYAQEFPTNLAILQKHEDWKDNYVKLREKGTELVTDIDVVEKELAKKKKDRQNVQPKLQQETQQQLQISSPTMPFLPPIGLPQGFRYELLISPPTVLPKQDCVPVHHRCQPHDDSSLSTIQSRPGMQFRAKSKDCSVVASESWEAPLH